MRDLYTGTTEYLAVTVTASVELNTQAVHFSFDRTTWLAAAWVGSAGLVRQARLLMNASNMPAAGQSTLYVRVNDGTEIPIFTAGVVRVN